MIKCLHVIYQGNWNTKDSIEGEEGEKPSIEGEEGEKP